MSMYDDPECPDCAPGWPCWRHKRRPAVEPEDYPNLKPLSDIELAMLQSHARKTGDTDFVNAILLELGRRQKKQLDNDLKK